MRFFKSSLQQVSVHNAASNGSGKDALAYQLLSTLLTDFLSIKKLIDTHPAYYQTLYNAVMETLPLTHTKGTCYKDLPRQDLIQSWQKLTNTLSHMPFAIAQQTLSIALTVNDLALMLTPQHSTPSSVRKELSKLKSALLPPHTHNALYQSREALLRALYEPTSGDSNATHTQLMHALYAFKSHCNLYITPTYEHLSHGQLRQLALKAIDRSRNKILMYVNSPSAESALKHIERIQTQALPLTKHTLIEMAVDERLYAPTSYTEKKAQWEFIVRVCQGLGFTAKPYCSHTPEDKLQSDVKRVWKFHLKQPISTSCRRVIGSYATVAGGWEAICCKQTLKKMQSIFKDHNTITAQGFRQAQSYFHALVKRLYTRYAKKFITAVRRITRRVFFLKPRIKGLLKITLYKTNAMLSSRMKPSIARTYALLARKSSEIRAESAYTTLTIFKNTALQCPKKQVQGTVQSCSHSFLKK